MSLPEKCYRTTEKGTEPLILLSRSPDSVNIEIKPFTNFLSLNTFYGAKILLSIQY